ncbi:MAG: DUF58 domain-containing protein [Planctomycetales bacterium]|nr:DUF58 domain-containing protein [Planctomycetales bacterium]
MLTRRAIWILMIAGAGFVAAIVLRHEPVALAALTVLFWVWLEWLVFQWRVLTADEVFQSIHRKWWDEGAAHASGQRSLVRRVDDVTSVQLQATPHRRLAGLRIWVEDVLPAGGVAVGGSPRAVSDARAGTAWTWSYLLLLRRLGRLTMPGLHVRVTDGAGLFEHHRFVPLRQELTVLPLLVRPETTVSVLKQNNAQLTLGQHRFQRPGGAGELLSIRDYLPGDPPKTIAWKVSARLGRLMSCEYERETPVRSTIITDLSLYQFVGRPGPAPADRVAGIAGSIARLLLADRDPVASLIVSGSNTNWLPHGFGERQLTRLLHTLLTHVGGHSVPPGIVFEDLVEVTWATCLHHYPELLDPRVNPQLGWLRFTRSGRRRRQRRQLAMALAHLQQSPPGYEHRLVEDRQELSFACRQFLADHPSDWIPLGVPPAQRLASARHATLDTICRSLVRGVARAKDNELFVVITAAPVYLDEVDKLEEAVRLARAAYHRVMLLYGVPEPDELQVADPAARRILLEERQRETEQSMSQLRERMGRVGAKVATFSDARLVSRIVAEVELLRSGRGRSVGTRG